MTFLLCIFTHFCHPSVPDFLFRSPVYKPQSARRRRLQLKIALPKSRLRVFWIFLLLRNPRSLNLHPSVWDHPYN